jgi:hypothetical protein
MLIFKGIWLGFLVMAMAGLLLIGFTLHTVKDNWGKDDVPLFDDTSKKLMAAGGVAFLVGAIYIGVKDF